MQREMNLTYCVLTPAQQRALDGLLEGVATGDVVTLKGRAGAGKTSILQQLHATVGGVLVGMREFIACLAGHQPAAIEEAFLQMVEQALAKHDIVIVDDLHLVTEIENGSAYRYLLDAALTAMLGEASALKKKLVFAFDGEAPWPIRRRAYQWTIDDFTPDDYGALCREILGEAAEDLEYDRIHRFAPGLSAQQLRNACHWLRREAGLDTGRFVDYLQAHHMASNVDLEEVERVCWSDLKGVDDLIHELEAKIALPFENDALRVELGLKPKRGVLLAGPPGTGKTTIGRALAHRLKSKFFMVDGTMIAGSRDFNCNINRLFQAAKKNAPAIIFIDDADVIFEGEDHHGFYRYLLTMLDGLESASAERVCVMLTAMHAGSLPPALLRSGRVELWLETKLPDGAARADILREKLANLPDPIGLADIPQIAAAAHGLTGADLKNVVDDAKLAFAHDLATGKGLGPPEQYFLKAVEAVRGNRRKYLKSRPPRLLEATPLGFAGEATAAYR